MEIFFSGVFFGVIVDMLFRKPNEEQIYKEQRRKRIMQDFTSRLK